MTGRIVGLLLLAPSLVQAQNSVYGVQGVGFPGRPLSTYARALGGGDAAFDPGSAINPATTAAFAGLQAGLSMATTFRSYTTGDSTASGLQETRFPFALVGSALGRSRLSLALSAGPYLERTFDIQTAGTTVLRGETVTILDRVASDGGASDLRGAVGLGLGRGLAIGAAAHVISGSSKLRIRREFSNAAYRNYNEQSQLTFSGYGASVGAVFRVSSGLQLAAAGRMDHELKVSRDTTVVERVNLPRSVTAGLRMVPIRGVTLASTATWRSWTDTGADLATPGVFDTWEIGSGLELGAGTLGLGNFPLRVGLRYAQLPFSGRPVQAHEWTTSGGTGLLMAGGRVAFDLAVERAVRDGAGAREVAWHIGVGVTVIPSSQIR